MGAPEFQNTEDLLYDNNTGLYRCLRCPDAPRPQALRYAMNHKLMMKHRRNVQHHAVALCQADLASHLAATAASEGVQPPAVHTDPFLGCYVNVCFYLLRSTIVLP